MNDTVNAIRTRIAVFGRRNAGKSSLVNALAGQNVAIVSDIPGTTTDPVSKAMEILPLGPCLVTDTAGLDDVGELGEKRVKKSLGVLETADIAVVAVPCGDAMPAEAIGVAESCRGRGVPLVVVRTKRDLAPEAPVADGEVAVSAKTGEGVEALRGILAAAMPSEKPPPLVSDLVAKGDIVLCVCPIDAAAPKGRLILPQQQVVRELLESGAAALVCQPGEIRTAVEKAGKGNIRFAITDSQAFAAVDEALDKDIPLTSFSILFARQKGDLATLAAGAAALKTLSDGDRVLVAEGCTHRRQCGDIGTVKIPALVRKFTGKSPVFEFSSGGDFPVGEEGKTLPKLVIHCGGCMLTRRAVLSRIERCRKAGVPVVNYGVAIALMNGIVADPATCMVARKGASKEGV